MPTLFRSGILTTSLLAALTVAQPAAAAQIIGGATDVTLTSAPTLTGLGLSFNTFGTASTRVGADGVPIASFLITGGTINDQTGGLLVRHDGSGLLFSAAGKTLSVGDFLIDTAASTVFASAIVNGTSNLGQVALFSIGSGLSLNLTAQGAGAFTSVFGAPDLTGARIGTADVNFVSTAAAVPEPGTWAMMIFGFGVIGYAARRRRSTVVAPAY